MWKTWYMYVVCSKIQEKRLVFVLVDKINSMCGDGAVSYTHLNVNTGFI